MLFIITTPAPPCSAPEPPSPPPPSPLPLAPDALAGCVLVTRFFFFPLLAAFFAAADAFLSSTAAAFLARWLANAFLIASPGPLVAAYHRYSRCYTIFCHNIEVRFIIIKRRPSNTPIRILNCVTKINCALVALNKTNCPSLRRHAILEFFPPAQVDPQCGWPL